jgi:hypothetical protein
MSNTSKVNQSVEVTSMKLAEDKLEANEALAIKDEENVTCDINVEESIQESKVHGQTEEDSYT